MTETPETPMIHRNLATALVAFQAEMPTVPKSNTARIPGKNGASGYSYQYADLVDVTDAAMPLLTKNGLAFICIPQRTENGSYELIGTLVHESGDTMTGALPMTGRQAQEIGSSLTYGRRYLLGTMTGIVTDEDEDGTLAAQNAQRVVRDEPQAADLMPPHQAVLSDRLNGLAPENQAAIRTWWPTATWHGEPLPPLKRLNPDQAAAVMEQVNRLEDPWANTGQDDGPNDPHDTQGGEDASPPA